MEKPKSKKKNNLKRVTPTKKSAASNAKEQSKVAVKKAKNPSAKLKQVKRTPNKHSSQSDSDDNNDEEVDSSESTVIQKKRKKPPTPTKTKANSIDTKDVVHKRMASLNASAMLAATYEVERHFDRCDSTYNGSSGAESEAPSSPKKIKEIKDEILDTKDVR